MRNDFKPGLLARRVVTPDDTSQGWPRCSPRRGHFFVQITPEPTPILDIVFRKRGGWHVSLAKTKSTRVAV
jgi:hypothetical protein